MLILVIVCGSIYYFHFFDSFQEKIIDHFFIKKNPPDNIVLIAVDDNSLKALGQWPWPREDFAKALNNIQGAQSIGIDINFSENSRVSQADDLSLKEAILNSQAPVTLPIELREDNQTIVQPLSIFLDKSKLGFVNVLSDSDGLIRKIQNQRSNYESFSKSLVNSRLGTPDSMRINYIGPANSYLTFSIIDVINGVVPQRIFNDSYVLIGVTSNSLKDNFQTPVGLMSGVEIHANTLNTIITGSFMKELGVSISLEIIAFLSLISSLLVVLVRRKFLFLILSLVILLIAIFITGIFSFIHGIVIPVLYFCLTTILSFGAMVIFQYIVESKEKQFIRRAFQYYLSPELIQELIKNPSKLVLGGEKREVSILFSDIRNFTTFSETMSPEELTKFMGEYFEVVSEIVLDNKGIIDKYIGDAIMAFWGAPLLNKNHAIDACKVALQMIRRLNEKNEEWKKKGKRPIQIGIGINTGEVVVGNMGSHRRFNYGIVGDEVNFTSRLEGLNKEYGTTCIISETTKNQITLSSIFSVRELDMVIVKGKTEPKRIFELITKNIDERLKNQISHFEEGRKLYMKGNWNEAAQKFRLALELGEDGPSKVFLERCLNLQKNPPVSWNGIYEFKTK